MGELVLRLLPPDLTGWELWHVRVPGRLSCERRYVSARDQLVKMPGGELVTWLRSLEILDAATRKGVA